MSDYSSSRAPVSVAAALPATVTLEEAIARAIKYNAVQRLRAMEEAVAQGTYQVSKFDMLPKLV
ncbi:MAG: hypothetical protein RSH52_17540, partial [Janthinobacterium sp.]